MQLITPDFGLVFWTTVVFLLFWYLIGKFALKPITKAIKEVAATSRNRTHKETN